MAQVSPDLQHQVSLMISSIPENIRKAISTEELEDRVLQAVELVRKSQQARTPGERRQLGEQARRILGARPRAETEAVVLAKMRKAEVIGNQDQAAELVRQAREELLMHPPAVRRGAPVAKAKAKADDDGQDELMARYDRDGNLTHVVRTGDATPVTAPPEPQARDKGPVDAGGTTGTGQPAKTIAAAAVPAAGPQPEPGDVPGRQVVKAAGPEQVIKSLGPKWMPAYDFTGRLEGAIKRSDVSPLPPGHVRKSVAAVPGRANIYTAQRKMVGTGRLADIISLADLRAGHRVPPRGR